MRILAIDTTSKNCSVAICKVDQDEVKTIAIENSDDEKTHSQKLMPLVSKVFEENNMSLDDINLLVCCLGPGSFTGIRIGVATVKAFADVKEIPVVGVTSLESLTYNVQEDAYIVPIINAKNNNAYAAAFYKNENYSLEIESVADNINMILNSFHEYLKDKTNSVTFVGDGSYEYKALINERFSDFNIVFARDNVQHSDSLAKCGFEKYKNGIFGDSSSISPVYLRKSQAERNADGEK